ncbi:MAG: hypothetical protein AAGC83_06415 [Pseudomonadota bacterium]
MTDTLPLTLDSFRASIDLEAPPSSLSPALTALWYAAKGDWEKAHTVAQSDQSTDGSWVHAYLHRVEGDLGNANYWYGRAGKSAPETSLDEEWAAISAALI